LEDELYPAYLKNIYDPPLVLYMKGTIQEEEKYLAVVGSRRATPMDWIWRRKYPESLLNAVLPL